MNRRAFLFAGLAASTTPAILSPARAAPSALQMIYIGGVDCPYCTMWKREHESEWLASPEFKRVTWIEVNPAHLRDAYQARSWPADLRDVLDQIPQKNGTPRFLIVEGGRIVSNEVGANRWTRTLDHLRNRLG